MVSDNETRETAVSDAELIEMRDRFRASGRPDKRQYAELFDELLQARFDLRRMELRLDDVTRTLEASANAQQARATLANRAAVREPAKCEACEGYGESTVTHDDGTQSSTRHPPCPKCNGTGQRSVEPKTETKCDGCGAVIDPETCGCGEPISGYHDNHSPIPMGCDCYRSPPVAPRPADAENKLLTSVKQADAMMRAADAEGALRHYESGREPTSAETAEALEYIKTHGIAGANAWLDRAIALLRPATPPAMSDEVREALEQAADFLRPGLMSNSLPTSRCLEIEAVLRRLAEKKGPPRV